MELFDLLSAVADSFKDLLDDNTRNRLLMQALRGQTDWRPVGRRYEERGQGAARRCRRG